MPRTVTVGLDGSPESLAAARWAAREAERRGLALRLVHAWDWQPQAQPLPDDPGHRHWGGRVLREATEQVQALHPGLEITSEQVPRPPVTALLAAAGDAAPLVIGSRGLSGLAGFLVGSVGLAVAAQTGRPVVLVRSGARRGRAPAGRGRTAVDRHPVPGCRPGTGPRTPRRRGRRVRLRRRGLPRGEAACRARLEPAALLRLRPAPGPGPERGTGRPGGERRRGRPGTLAREVPRCPGRHAARVVTQPAIGNAGSHLVDAAADASPVVVGRRIRRTPLGSRIGPVTHAVLHHAAAPVAVVPHG